MRALQPLTYAGEPWFDPDAAICPVVAMFLSAWNDDLPRADREVILAPLIPTIVGTRNTALETRRGLLVGEWLIRTQAVAWLRIARAYTAAGALESGPAVSDSAAVSIFFMPLKAAQWAAIDVRDAVWATPAHVATPEERAAHLGKSWEAPWAVAAEAWSKVGMEEAQAATAAAALDAARAAVWMVADLRAHAEVWNLAHGTARTAAHAGFGLGDPEELRATRGALQRSAAELVIRMIEAR